MNSKAIILIGAIGALAIILLRKVRGYADMAQQITFVPKVYDKPKMSLSKLTIPICIDITNPTTEKATVTRASTPPIISTAKRKVAMIQMMITASTPPRRSPQPCNSTRTRPAAT